MNPEQIGAMLFCGMTGLPFVAGAALAWWLRGRADAYGLLGAILPAFIREKIA